MNQSLHLSGGLQSVHLSGKEQESLRELYATQFKLGENKITHEGLYNLLNLAGIPTTKQEVARVYEHIDTDHNGLIEESEFLKYMEEKKKQIDISEELERTYLLMSGPRGVSIQAFRDFVLSVCPGFGADVAETLSQEVDGDMDGFINKEEFMYIFTQYGKK